MKLITYLAHGAKLKPVAVRQQIRQADGYEGEIMHEAAYQNILSTIIRFRKEDETVWHWRGVETNGTHVWYYDIEPDASGCVLADKTLLKRGDLPGFEHGPAYEYMVEGMAPLPVDSPDWLIKPVGDEVADVTKWRNKLRPGK